MTRKSGFLSVFFFLVSCAGISAEIYQYQDENGNYFYTDNSAEIPSEGLEGVKALDELPTFDAASPINSSGESLPSDFEENESSRNETKRDFSSANIDVDKITADQLEGEKKQLDQICKKLQEEKSALSGRSTAEMNPKQKNNYEQQLRDLNERIDRYQEQQKEFNLKVELYNAKIEAKKGNETKMP